METRINRSTAQTVVDAIKELCGYDSNFIDKEGYIYASTNPARVGRFHEVGKRVVETRRAIEVERGDTYWGTQPGVNQPIFYDGDLIAVIGITGPPEEVRKFSLFAGRLTSLILKEHDLANRSLGERLETNYIIRSLIHDESMSRERFDDFMHAKGLDADALYRVAILHINIRYNPSNLNLIEKDVTDRLRHIPQSIYRFQYPNEYVLIFQSDQKSRVLHKLELLQQELPDLLKISIGSEESIFMQHKSYEAAQTLLRIDVAVPAPLLYDDFDLEILLGSTADADAMRYLKKVLYKLSDADCKLLTQYYAHNMSLKETGQALYIHTNTLQYRLDRIQAKCGYAPRQFRDAVVLYLALRLDQRLNKTECR